MFIILFITMSVTSLGPKSNLILFDDEAPSMKPSISQGDLGRIPDVLSALGDLNKRILKIQIYEQVLRDKAHSLESKGASISNNVPNHTHQQILNVLERKLHILILESNKALEDLKDEIQRVMTKEVMDRKVNDYELKATSERLEKMYLDRIKEMQSTHSEEILKLQRKNQTIERTFQQRLQRIESKLMQRIKQLERREETFKAQISRLKTQTIDSKRFEQLELELHQTKVALKNLPQKTLREGVSTARQDALDRDTTHSRMRRNKIFEKKQEEMPSAMVSPIRNQYSQVASLNLLTKQLEDLTSQLNLNFNQHNNSQGSDEDVFFYPESSKAQMVPQLQSSTKIFSPFDVNNKY